MLPFYLAELSTIEYESGGLTLRTGYKSSNFLPGSSHHFTHHLLFKPAETLIPVSAIETQKVKPGKTALPAGEL